MTEPEYRSYYGRPILKEPVWKPEIPWYFFTGGIGGSSASLALAAHLTGNDRLARNANLVALAAMTVSPLLLIRDLGRPMRFLNMMRVFKVTSPMSVGSWLLALQGTATGVAGARAGAFAAAGAGPPRKFFTSSVVTRPCLPVGVTWSSCTPIERASRRVAGVALTLSPPALASMTSTFAAGAAAVGLPSGEGRQRKPT